MRPRVSLGLPSTMSFVLIFTSFTLFASNTCNARLTLLIWWTLRFPLSRFSSCPHRTSNNVKSLVPSLKSWKRSLTRGWSAFASCELIHLEKVFLCTSSRSSILRLILNHAALDMAHQRQPGLNSIIKKSPK
uniref:Putative secreted protein n=1 Tax=Ixodes ricinus TaxID=34613 RepID=A0A6B0URD1_IXORI